MASPSLLKKGVGKSVASEGAPKSTQETLSEYLKARQYAAGQSELLAQQAKELLDPELDRLLKQFLTVKDPVSGASLITIKDVEDSPWGKRITLPNGHFLEFVVTKDGKLMMRTSVPKGKYLDRGYFDNIQTTTQMPREVFLWQNDRGVAARTLIDAFVGEGVHLADFEPEESDKL